jgi:hypothetical protein
MLYDQGYTIKGVQKLLRENGNQFLSRRRALLQEALFDLLECKRLLDQVR